MPCTPNADVTLTPQPQQKGPVKWSMDICGAGKGSFGNYPVLTVAKSQNPSDAHLVYTIDNPPGSTWKFVKDGGALWVTSNGQDPTQPSTDPHVPAGSIHTENPNPPNPATDDTRLVFTDHNSNPAVTLHYTLNFVNGTQKSSTLDPIIQNNGCCTVTGGSTGGDRDTTSTYMWYAIGAVALIVVVLLAVKFMQRSPSE